MARNGSCLAQHHDGGWGHRRGILACRPMSRRSTEREARTGPILDWLRQREEEMAALLVELVAMPTENPPGRNYRACADALEKRLRESGIECERVETADLKKDGAESSVCLLAGYGRGEPTLYFHGHYDVVPAQTPEQFRPLRKEHFVFGRGSCDMKGGIVAMLYAILALKETAAELNGRIGLTLVPNEETGGEGGSAWLAAQGRLRWSGNGLLLAGPTSGVGWNAELRANLLRVLGHGEFCPLG